MTDWFDLMQTFTAAAPESVRAHGATFGAGKERLSAVEGLAPDTADIQVRYDNGHVCLLALPGAFQKARQPRG